MRFCHGNADRTHRNKQAQYEGQQFVYAAKHIANIASGAYCTVCRHPEHHKSSREMLPKSDVNVGIYMKT